VRGPALVAWQVRFEQKQFWRSLQSAFFTFAFPLVFLVVFGTINRDQTVAELGGIPYDQFFIPSIIAFGLMSACYTNLAIGLATRREAGILKRLHVTPLPSWAFFGGLAGNALVVAVLSAAITTTLGVTAYGVHVPYRLLPLAVGLGLGAVTFGALGTAVSALVPNAEAAPAIVNFPFFVLLFLSGTFFPTPAGSVVERIGDVFPLAHLNRVVLAAFDPRERGTGLHADDVLVLLAWAAGAGAVAVRRFRWEPRR